MARPYSVLMVCTGNICRSPTAEAVLRQRAKAAGLGDRVQVDSAGTTDYHAGSPPDERSAHHASLRGYDLSALRARQVVAGDFDRFDLILAMDRGHLQLLEAGCPPQQRHKLKLFMEFAPDGMVREVADPYLGGREGFETVLDNIEAASDGLVRFLATRA